MEGRNLGNLADGLRFDSGLDESDGVGVVEAALVKADRGDGVAERDREAAGEAAVGVAGFDALGDLSPLLRGDGCTIGANRRREEGHRENGSSSMRAHGRGG